MDAAPLPDHFLYASDDGSLFLIDIPASLAHAQDFEEGIPAKTLKSCQPVAEPYPSTEPKSARARAKLSNHGDFDDLHAVYQDLCAESLQQLQSARVNGPYCLPRHVADEDNVPNSASSSDDPTEVLKLLVTTSSPSSDEPSPVPSIDSLMMQSTERPSDAMTGTIPFVQDVPGWGLALGAGPLRCSSSIELKASDQKGPSRLYIPRNSCFVVGPCNLHHGMQLFRRLAQRYTPTSTFDIIYMDPPWPNRSAKRKGPGGYRIEQGIKAVKRTLLDMNLWVHLKHGGHVAVWITNRAACRDLIMTLFDQWSLVLVEEWVYLKVAANGEPVTPIDGAWRKPYEVLLIAQSGHDSPTRESPVRRVIAAVPDLHSRKPGLKELFDRLLLGPDHGADAKVLEIFARNLTAGWMSWGDEALKFNWDKHWT